MGDISHPDEFLGRDPTAHSMGQLIHPKPSRLSQDLWTATLSTQAALLETLEVQDRQDP